MATDIRELDGEPHEVAQAAGGRVELALAEAANLLEDFQWAARGAYQTAQYITTGHMPDVCEWETSAQFNALQAQLNGIKSVLGNQKTLTKAAAWNPRGLLTEG
jgi:hypothetical protein